MTLVIFHGAKCTPPRKGSIGFGGKFRLSPGRNSLPSTIQLKEFKKNKEGRYQEEKQTVNTLDWLYGIPSFTKKIEQGILEIIDKEIPTDLKEGQVSSLKAEELFSIIAVEPSVKKLETWAEEESNKKRRKTVLNAIRQQIKTIKEGKL